MSKKTHSPKNKNINKKKADTKTLDSKKIDKIKDIEDAMNNDESVDVKESVDDKKSIDNEESVDDSISILDVKDKLSNKDKKPLNNKKNLNKKDKKGNKKKMSKKVKIPLIILSSLVFVFVVLAVLIIYTDWIISEKYKLSFFITRDGLVGDIFDNVKDKKDFSFDIDLTIDSIQADDNSLISYLNGGNAKLSGTYQQKTKILYSDITLQYMNMHLADANVWVIDDNVTLTLPNLLDGYLYYSGHSSKKSTPSDNADKVTAKRKNGLWSVIGKYFNSSKVKKQNKTKIKIAGQTYKSTKYKLTLGYGSHKGDVAYLYTDKKGNLIKIEYADLFTLLISPEKTNQGYYIEFEGHFDNTSMGKLDIAVSGYLKLKKSQGIDTPVIDGTMYDVREMNWQDYISLLDDVKKKIFKNPLLKFLQ